MTKKEKAIRNFCRENGHFPPKNVFQKSWVRRKNFPSPQTRSQVSATGITRSHTNIHLQPHTQKHTQSEAHAHILCPVYAHLTVMISLSRERGLLWRRHEPLQSLALRFGTNSFLLLDPLY